MGRSGTTSLWSSGLTGHWHKVNLRQPIRRVRSHQPGGFHQILDCLQRGITISTRTILSCRQNYRVKPHEQLVPVSLTHYCASTPGLSTSWSRTTLQGAQGPGKTHLETSFPLRCFQRLSLPHIATRRCHWRDNRYTRGASTPVLSY